MRSQRPLLLAIVVWLVTDVAHTIWHVANGDSIGTLVGELAIDAVLAFIAAAALWLPDRMRRPVGGAAALLVGAWSIIRGISGTAFSEGGVMDPRSIASFRHHSRHRRRLDPCSTPPSRVGKVDW